MVTQLHALGKPNLAMFDLDHKFETGLALTSAPPVEREELVADHLDMALLRLQLLQTDRTRILMLDQSHLQLLEQVNLLFGRNLAIEVAVGELLRR